MKRFLVSSVLVYLALCTGVLASDSDVKLTFGGFVRFDAFYDSRDIVSTREDHVAFFPLPEVVNNLGEDVYETPSTTLIASYSRARVLLDGPEAFGAKINGRIEGDFFGTSTSTLHGFRLRHAFVNLDFGKTSVLFGQSWHPFYVVECYASLVNSNFGMPFQPLARNPQIKVTYETGKSKVYLAMMSERDFRSIGPEGSSNSYIKDVLIPGFNTGYQFQAERGHVAGFGVDFKTLKPRNFNEFGEKIDESVSRFAVYVYSQVVLKPITVKGGFTYAQNPYDLMMLGGYAVTGVNMDQSYEYTPTTTSALWLDISQNKKSVQPGLFIGYTKNHGLGDDLYGDTVYGRGFAVLGVADIDNIFRISPRVAFNSGKVRFAVETEYTAVAYGIANEQLEVKNTEQVANLRLSFAVYYFF